MESFFRISDPAAEGGHGPAPRPRRPAAAETLFIAAAADRHVGPSARAESVERFVVNPCPEPKTAKQRQQGLSTSFPCLSRLERNPYGSSTTRSRLQNHSPPLRFKALNFDDREIQLL